MHQHLLSWRPFGWFVITYNIYSCMFFFHVFQTEGSTQTMGRVILECEHFVPAVVKFVTMNVATDGAVITSEPYLVSYAASLSFTVRCVV